MRISAVTASLLALALATPFISEPAFAQGGNKGGERRAKGGGGNGNGSGEQAGGKKGESEDIDGPVDMSKFPGVGSIDSWKTSVPEFRSGMDKMKDHRWDEAISHFRASIALYEYQPRAFLEIGKATEAKGGLVADAEKSYRQCVKLDNQSWAGWKNLGNVLFMQKRYPEAREAVSNALALNPPSLAHQRLDKMVQMIDAGQRDSNTSGQNTGQ